MPPRSLAKMAEKVALEEDVWLSPKPHEALAQLINQMIAVYQRNYGKEFPIGRTMAKMRRK